MDTNDISPGNPNKYPYLLPIYAQKDPFLFLSRELCLRSVREPHPVRETPPLPYHHTRRMKSTEVQNPRRILHRGRVPCQCACAEIDHALRLAERVVLSVLAPTRASGISRHRFGQGWMLLTIVGYPLALRCVSSGESRPRVSLNN